MRLRRVLSLLRHVVEGGLILMEIWTINEVLIGEKDTILLVNEVMLISY